MLFSNTFSRDLASFLSCGLLAFGAMSACADVEAEDPIQSTSSALVGQCTLGDGYVVPNGGSFTVYTVRCPSDCNDYPNGTYPTELFCKNGVLGESNPALSGGTVDPIVVAAHYNSYSRCTALPNPYSTPQWGTNATRKTCVRL